MQIVVRSVHTIVSIVTGREVEFEQDFDVPFSKGERTLAISARRRVRAPHSGRILHVCQYIYPCRSTRIILIVIRVSKQVTVAIPSFILVYSVIHEFSNGITYYITTFLRLLLERIFCKQTINCFTVFEVINYEISKRS